MRRGWIAAWSALAVAAACHDYASISADAPPEAGAPDAVGADGAPPPPAPPSPSTFCADASWICDDFDDAGPTWPKPPWTTLARDPAATAQIVTPAIRAPSPPSAAQFDVEPTDAGAGVLVEAPEVGLSSGLRCQLQILPISATTRPSSSRCPSTARPRRSSACRLRWAARPSLRRAARSTSRRSRRARGRRSSSRSCSARA